jgi:hypothetical protein
LNAWDPARIGRVALQAKVPWVPNFEEILNYREEEDEPVHIRSASYGHIAHDGVVAQDVRDAIHEENMAEARRGFTEDVHGHRLYGSV